MARNIEIKARISHAETWLERAQALADSGPSVLVQDDTFFACPNGRLKLREFDPGKGELILYQRPDHAGPKESCYSIVETSRPAQLREILGHAYGEAGRVRKKRTLFLSGRTRIHLDKVESLGDFIELEVVLADGETVETGTRVAQELMARLDIDPACLVEEAYVDLLNRQKTGQAPTAPATS